MWENLFDLHNISYNATISTINSNWFGRGTEVWGVIIFSLCTEKEITPIGAVNNSCFARRKEEMTCNWSPSVIDHLIVLILIWSVYRFLSCILSLFFCSHLALPAGALFLVEARVGVAFPGDFFFSPFVGVDVFCLFVFGGFTLDSLEPSSSSSDSSDSPLPASRVISSSPSSVSFASFFVSLWKNSRY